MKPIDSLPALRGSYGRYWQNDELARATQEVSSYYEWVLDLLQAKPGERLLDIACGEGHAMDCARRREVRPFGIDIALIPLTASYSFVFVCRRGSSVK